MLRGNSREKYKQKKRMKPANCSSHKTRDKTIIITQPLSRLVCLSLLLLNVAIEAK